MMQKSFQNKGGDGTYSSRIVISDQNVGINEKPRNWQNLCKFSLPPLTAEGTLLKNTFNSFKIQFLRNLF
jgi:hypothetical protein